MISNRNMAGTHVSMTSEGVRDAKLGFSFYITIAKFGMTDVHLPKHQNTWRSLECG